MTNEQISKEEIELLREMRKFCSSMLPKVGNPENQLFLLINTNIDKILFKNEKDFTLPLGNSNLLQNQKDSQELKRIEELLDEAGIGYNLEAFIGEHHKLKKHYHDLAESFKLTNEDKKTILEKNKKLLDALDKRIKEVDKAIPDEKDEIYKTHLVFLKMELQTIKDKVKEE